MPNASEAASQTFTVDIFTLKRNNNKTVFNHDKSWITCAVDRVKSTANRMQTVTNN